MPTIPLRLDAIQFIQSIKKSIDQLRKFKQFTPYLNALENAFKSINTSGVGPVLIALKKLNEVAGKNKLVFKAAGPPISNIINKFDALYSSTEKEILAAL